MKRKEILVLFVVLILIIGQHIMVTVTNAEDEKIKEEQPPSPEEIAKTILPMPSAGVSFGEIVSVDKKSSTIEIKDMRTGEINTLVVRPDTKISKTVNLKIEQVEKGEFANAFYWKEDDKDVAKNIFIMEKMPVLPPGLFQMKEEALPPEE